MPIKMIANRRYYHTPAGKEFAKGAEFSVDTEKEAARLERLRRASRAKPPEPPKAKALSARHLTAALPEDPSASPRAPVAEDYSPRRYRRRDLTPEE
jgi:hypothetical protein